MEGLEESGGSYSVMYFVTFVLSITVFVFVWLFRHTRNDAASANLRKGETGAAHSKSAKLNKGKAKHSSSKNWKKSAHHAAASVFSHPELVTNFKGHTAPLTSGDISSNGKYFISAAEEEGPQHFDPGGGHEGYRHMELTFPSAPAPEDAEDMSSVSSGSQLSTTSNAASDTEDATPTKMSRRQRRNLKKKVFAPQASSGARDKPNSGSKTTRVLYTRLGLGDDKLCSLLQPYCLSTEDRILNGYPYATEEGVFVFKNAGYSTLEAALGGRRLHSSELEFKCDLSESAVDDGGLSDSDSIEDLSTPELIEDSSRLYGRTETSRDVNMNYCKTQDGLGFDLRCRRCKSVFSLSRNVGGCHYHPKKAVLKKDGRLHYTCCSRPKRSAGCQRGKRHVYHHLSMGLNGPLDDFVATQPCEVVVKHKVIAMDCEMVFTSLGFELARVTLVTSKGKCLLDLYVRPLGEVFDYNTQFSGIEAKHLVGATSLSHARTEVLSFLKSEVLLVGHSLESDLIALKVIHRKVLDTSLLFGAIFPDGAGSSDHPHRLALKTLVSNHLGRDIQRDLEGHSSFEDACAALELVLFFLLNPDRGQGDKVAPVPVALQAIVT